MDGILDKNIKPDEKTLKNIDKLEPVQKQSEDLPHLGGRRFYEIPDSEKSSAPREKQQGAGLYEYIYENVVGNDATFSGPFGRRKVVYADYTASGRALSFLEKYIYQQILPYYGNTHTTSTVTALQSTLFRHEARDVIRNSVNASEHDAVIFVSSGATGAVHKLVSAVGGEKDVPPPIVVAGPWEHHSNLLPWRECASEVFNIREDAVGQVDLDHLEETLRDAQRKQRTGQRIIGCFSAASNVTGIMADVDAITILLHRFSALSVWDYATAAPHVAIDMNPVAKDPKDQPLVYKDAVLVSPHKFVGGVDSPGVLVAKKNLFHCKPIPSEGGGGSVFFVTENGHRYLQEPEMREEGGTPAIVGSVRAGLAFQLKEAIGTQVIQETEQRLTRKALDAWEAVEGLQILGSTSVSRLPIFSLMFVHPGTGLYLHHNFVTSLLNDVFGIQSRGGCACAGPYAQVLMGMDFDLAQRYESLLLEDQRLDRTHLRRYREYSQNEVLRPGFVRLNLPFFAPESEIDFILSAVAWVARHGHRFLPFYLFNRETGEWRHKDHQVFRDRRWLGHISYNSGQMSWTEPIVKDKGPLPASPHACLQAADEILKLVPDASKQRHLGDQRLLFDDVEGTKNLRWFVLPSEIQDWEMDGKGRSGSKAPFTPKRYEGVVDRVGKWDESGTEMGSDAELGPCFEAEQNERNSDLKDNRELERTNFKPENEATLIKVNDINSPLDEAIVNSNPSSNQSKSRKELNKLKRDPKSEKKRVQELQKNKLRVAFSPASPSVTLGDGGKEVCPIREEETSCPIRKGEGDAPSSCPCLVPANQVLESRRQKMTPSSSQVTTSAAKWFAPGKKLYKPTAEAIQEFGMIEDGDRVLVCLSGGKDSLSLLHTMRQYQFVAKSRGVRYTLGAVTVDPLSPSYDPSPLIPYLAALGVPYLYEEQDILAQAAACNPDSICSFCSRMKRGRLYSAARREGYNVLAFGQHLDDLAESFLMSVFHNGLLRTMKANYAVRQKDLRVIRPFIYVREKDTRNFAEKSKLPVIPENCPACFEAPKERHRFKQILASQELLFPNVYSSLLEAMKPLMAFDTNASEGFKDRLLIANQNNFQNGGLKEEELDLNEF